MRLLQLSKKITIMIGLLALTSCASGRYRPGDCFIWTFPGGSEYRNEVYSVSLGDYEFYRYGYAKLRYPDSANIDYVDENSTRVMCSSTDPHKSGKF
jgi:hypothetical protein